MDVIEYINTITSNFFNDWVRCHNDMLHNNRTSIDNTLCDDLDDKEIRIIGHILKILYNEKITMMNKFYLLVSIEENLEYFIRTENGAINLVQSLSTDLKNILHSKWDCRYTCQLVIVICSTAVNYDLFISSHHQCVAFISGFLDILFKIISSDNMATNWTNLKFTALSSLLHLESTYPTILSQYDSKFADLVQKERLIYFELLLQLYSLVFKNNVLNKCRLQRGVSVASDIGAEQAYDSQQIISFITWTQERDSYETKMVGSQSTIVKTLRTILDQGMAYLSPLAMNVVVDNCLAVTKCLSQYLTSLWSPFIGRFICSQNLSVLESLVSLKRASTSGFVKEDILPGEQLEETLLAVLNNFRINIPRRQMVAQWLYSYPIDEQIVHLVTGDSKPTDTISCTYEPELIRHLYLRSIDTIEIKYCKLMLLNRAIKTAKDSDCNSCLLYSSLKEIMKSLHYFDSDTPSNILLRVMFAMHIRHSYSVLARDFESSLETIVVNYPNILSAVMFYLNGLEKYLVTDEQSRNFSAKCLTQIAKLSSEKLLTLTSYTDFSSIRLHIKVLNYVIKFTDMDLTEYLVLLRELLTSCKVESNITWFDEAYDLVLHLCFNIIKKYGSSKFYQELTDILNDIRDELFGNGMEIRANFLYALMVSLPSEKINSLVVDKKLEAITEKDFELIRSALIESYLDECLLILHRKTPASTGEEAQYQYVEDVRLEGYLDFLRCHTFMVSFDAEIRTKKNVAIETFLYGISVSFPTDSYFVEVTSWHMPKIRCPTGGLSIRRQLDVTVKEAESFSISATLAATKLDGTFVIYSVETDSVDIIDLALELPIKFPSTDSKNIFLKNLLTNRLLSRSFVSINFGDETRQKKFHNVFDKFMLMEEDEVVLFVMFLPPDCHIALGASRLREFCWRFDIYTDLNIINLLAIEQSLKRFEL